MKLTNLSLSILVALGLIACGGSDDNSNAAADNNNAGHQQGGKGGSGGVPQEEKKPEQTNNDDKKDDQKTGITPERVAPDLKVPADLQTIVNSRKKSFIDRGFSDTALGYSSGDYSKKESTDPADIRYSSIYNFADQDDLIPQSAAKGKGGIFVAPVDDIQKDTLNAWALGKDGNYYRVKSKVDKNSYSETTKFEIVNSADVPSQTGFGANYGDINQSDVVFIANAKKTTGAADKPANVLKLGKKADFDAGQSQAILNTVSALGTNYNAYGTGQELDLSKLPVKREIQTEEVTGQYSIINGKASDTSVDDKVLAEKIKIGHIKAYNLPYSAAYVTTDASGKYAKNIFNFQGAGAFQVVGMQTVSLPKDGRAFYKGKSFSATTEGDVDLVADFFSDRAGIVGAVTNRKDLVKNKALPELTLNRITLTDPSSHNITGFAGVKGGEAGYDAWSVTLFGLEAQEAAGFIGTGSMANVGGKMILTGVGTPKEVFNTQRGALSNHSNDSQ